MSITFRMAAPMSASGLFASRAGGGGAVGAWDCSAARRVREYSASTRLGPTFESRPAYGRARSTNARDVAGKAAAHRAQPSRSQISRQPRPRRLAHLGNRGQQVALTRRPGRNTRSVADASISSVRVSMAVVSERRRPWSPRHSRGDRFRVRISWRPRGAGRALQLADLARGGVHALRSSSRRACDQRRIGAIGFDRLS